MVMVGTLFAYEKSNYQEKDMSKKFIVIGAMDGIPPKVISDALQYDKREVVFSVNQFFV